MSHFDKVADYGPEVDTQKLESYFVSICAECYKLLRYKMEILNSKMFGVLYHIIFILSILYFVTIVTLNTLYVIYGEKIMMFVDWKLIIGFEIPELQKELLWTFGFIALMTTEKIIINNTDIDLEGFESPIQKANIKDLISNEDCKFIGKYLEYILTMYITRYELVDEPENEKLQEIYTTSRQSVIFLLEMIDNPSHQTPLNKRIRDHELHHQEQVATGIHIISTDLTKYNISLTDQQKETMGPRDLKKYENKTIRLYMTDSVPLQLRITWNTICRDKCCKGQIYIAILFAMNRVSYLLLGLAAIYGMNYLNLTLLVIAFVFVRKNDMFFHNVVATSISVAVVLIKDLILMQNTFEYLNISDYMTPWVYNQKTVTISLVLGGTFLCCMSLFILITMAIARYIILYMHSFELRRRNVFWDYTKQSKKPSEEQESNVLMVQYGGWKRPIGIGAAKLFELLVVFC